MSGKLYKSNLLLFDRQTDSLWSQLLQQAITGSLTGRKLVMVSAQHTTWDFGGASIPIASCYHQRRDSSAITGSTLTHHTAKAVQRCSAWVRMPPHARATS